MTGDFAGLMGHGLTFATAWVATALLACGLALAGCSRAPADVRLRAVIAEVQSGLEGRDASVLDAALAPDFIGPNGLDRDGARRMARAMFLRHRDVRVVLGPLLTDVRGQHATVRFTAALAGSSGLLPDSGQVYEVETAWRLEAGEWRLVNASW